ncbi:MAG TPA: tripartite tricarboxylate transporter substrate-binding protein [Burkholderiales bacterium]|nr:tripartite tricarboxylate transporter substrate-binding protein [Burkholderiales bacterium]
MKRLVLAVGFTAAGFTAALACGAALGQAFPVKPLTLIVPFPPGGSTDIVGRIAAEGLAKALAQPVVVDNRGGAGGALGARAIAEAAPDGYTLGVATVSTHVVNPIVKNDLRYDPLKDFTYISQIAAVPDVLSVHPAVPARTLGELIALARANPGGMNAGSPGVGSLGHMRLATFNYAANVSVVHVPYKGAGPALTGVLAGQVQMLYDNLPSSLPHIKAGKLRALAVASPQRVPVLPDVPTFAEAGLPLMNDGSWFGLVGPSGLPAAVAEKVHAALVEALKQPEALARLENAAATPVGNSPEAFRAAVAQALENGRRIVREANLKFD